MPITQFQNRNYNNDVLLGNVPNTVADILFGINKDIDTGSAPEDVWSLGGTYTGQPVNDIERIRITSTSAQDAPGGTGAEGYILFGLKSPSSQFYETEFIPANGLSPAVSQNEWWRINRVLVTTAGSNGGIVGTATIQHDVTIANIFGIIEPGVNRTQAAVYTVPAGFQMGVNKGIISIGRVNGSPGHATVCGVVRAPGSIYECVFTYSITDGGPIPFQFDYLGFVPEGSDIKFTVLDVSDNNTIVSCSMNFILNKI